MKVFVSWSGELSCQIAEVLKKWIPCIIQSVDVFFSPEDIEKGDNWDKTISSELSECKYGIICLTSDNTSAPWINFEAGAIAKSLDSKVTALMVNVNFQFFPPKSSVAISVTQNNSIFPSFLHLILHSKSS